MSGRVEAGGWDLVAEVIAGRVVKLPTESVEEDIAGILFSDFTNLLRRVRNLPQDPNPELMHISEDLTGEAIEKRSYEAHVAFMDEIVRKRGIWESDHFLDATVIKDDQLVKVRMQLEPGSGHLLRKPAEFKISFPDSAVTEVFILKEKAATVGPSGKRLTIDDMKALENLCANLNESNTRIIYKVESKSSSNS